MFKVNISKISEKISEYLILMVVFLVPLYFAVVLKNANVFELNKIVLFKMLTILLFLSTLIGLIFGKKRLIPVITLSALSIPLAYVLVQGLASLFSSNVGASIFGYYNRQQGLVSQFYYLLFFSLFLINITDIRQIRNVLAALYLGSVPICVYGVVQFFGLDPMHWIEDTSFRITGTFGQPNFFAAYLLLVMPLAIYFYRSLKHGLLKLAVVAIFLLQLFCLYATFSRAAWIAFFLGIVVFFTVWFIISGRSGHKERKKLLVVLGALFLLLAAMLALSPKAQIRMKLLFNAGADSVASRLDTWSAGWEAVKERPLLGYGPETQGDIFATKYKKDWAYQSNVNSYPNRAHNFVLDMLLTGGLIGLAAYLLLLGWFFRMAFANLRRKELSSYLLVSIMLGVLMYHISLLFGFSVVSTDIIMWTFFAVIASLYLQKKSKDSTGDIIGKYISKLNQYVLIAVVLILSVVGFFQINRELKTLLADYYFRELQSAYAEDDFFSTIALYELIEETGVREEYYAQTYGIMLAEAIPYVFEDSLAIPMKQEIERLFPRVHETGFEAELFRALAFSTLYSEEGDYAKAEDTLLDLIERSPEMPMLKRFLGKLYLSGEEYDKAIASYQSALADLPDIENTVNKPNDLVSGGSKRLMNDTHKREVMWEMGLINLGLGQAYVQIGDFEKANQAYAIAEEMAPPSYLLYAKIAYYNKKTKAYDKAISYFNKAWQRNVNNYIWPYEIANIYFVKKNYIMAMNYIEQANGINPNHKLIRDLRKKIKNAIAGVAE